MIKEVYKACVYIYLRQRRAQLLQDSSETIYPVCLWRSKQNQSYSYDIQHTTGVAGPNKGAN
jgi:hypothetical protein